MTEKDKEIQDLRRELERKDKEIALLQELHYLDLSEIAYQRRQIDFLMEGKPDTVPGSEFRDCRNELCLKCGSYQNAHNGACDGCRWRQSNG